MIVAVSAQPEHIAEDPLAGEALDIAMLGQLREQISYTLSIATQQSDVVENHEFHLIISQSGVRHDWALFGIQFTEVEGGGLFSGDEATHGAAFAAGMQQAILVASDG
jgi:hypothetical protein